MLFRSVSDIVLDSDSIRQVFLNLLANAIKFGKDGSEIKVSISSARLNSQGNEKEAIRVSVFDQGLGIPESELKSIFDKFTQSTRTRTGAGGTGLGLPICLEIVERHAGEIWAENVAQGGAVFHVVLPIEGPGV